MRLLIEAANTRVAVENGHIVELAGTFDRTIELPGCELRPGLINAHDHLHRNHYGRLGAPPYANAYAWANDIQIRYAARIAAGRAMPRREALLRGAWKNLLSGVTHVVHHDVWEADFDRDFPIKVVNLANADSLGMAREISPPVDTLFALHVAEGVDRNAADEVRILALRGLLNRNLIAAHMVGVDSDGVSLLRAAGSAVVLCPTSNQFLFGRRVPDALLAGGIDILLGSDSLLTGAGTLLDELHVLRGTLSDARLLDAVGPLAARRLGLPVSVLQPGMPADLVAFRRPLPGAGLDDVALVMTAGKLRVLDPELVRAPCGGQILYWRGVRRWISQAAPL